MPGVPEAPLASGNSDCCDAVKWQSVTRAADSVHVAARAWLRAWLRA
jgi:hypothetical protein